MKKIKLILLGFTFIVPAFISCDKCEGTDTTRPALTEDELKWVNVANKTPYYKITTIESDGDTIIDTIQGTYSLTIQEQKELIDDCYHISYKTYSNNLSLPYNGGNYGASIVIDNYEDRLTGKIASNKPYLTPDTALDTVTVNGKLYQNVYLGPFTTTGFEYYYAKGIGFIYINRGESIELIP